MDLLTGRGCRKCKYKKQAERQRRTPEQFVKEMSVINPDIIVLGKYTKAGERVDVQCKQCGKKWSPVASSLLAGTKWTMPIRNWGQILGELAIMYPDRIPE